MKIPLSSDALPSYQLKLLTIPSSKNGHHSITDGSLGSLLTIPTFIIRTSPYYGQLTWFLKYQSSCNLWSSGAPKDCFVWNICSKKQNFSRNFDCSRKAKNFLPFCDGCLAFGLWVCHILSPNLAFIPGKRSPKNFGFDNMLQKGIRTSLASVRVTVESRIFGKVISKL